MPQDEISAAAMLDDGISAPLAPAPIDRLRREVAKLKAERDILKKPPRDYREGLDMRFVFIAKHRGIWPVA